MHQHKAYCPMYGTKHDRTCRGGKADMTSGDSVQILIAAITLVLSVSASLFVSGTHWGEVRQSLRYLHTDRVRQSDITGIKDRLSRIEGMFTLTLRDKDK